MKNNTLQVHHLFLYKI